MEIELSEERSSEISQNDTTALRRCLVKKIEDIVRDIVFSITNDQKPSLRYNDGKYSGWMRNDLNSEQLANNSARVKTIRFSGNNARQRFALIMRILSHAHAKLIQNLDRTGNEFYCTRRAFYYELKNEHVKRFLRNQSNRIVDWAINEVTLILNCSPWDIGFISSSKGLVAGDLSLYFGDEERATHYEPGSGQPVPDVLANVSRVRTEARFVLVAEKHSVFQRLLAENCPTYNRCVLVTGKGYPDVATRMMVRVLSVRARLPVYALVDANPYGFEIMCVYRYGTTNNFGYRQQLLCPEMRWLGIHYIDLIKLGVPRIALTKRDIKKIEELQNRNCLDVDFSKHFTEMRLGKAEIESIKIPTKRFLTELFIPAKIRNKEYF